MSIYRIVLILDDTKPPQLTLLGEIQNTLSSIASNLPPVTGESLNNIEVRKLA